MNYKEEDITFYMQVYHDFDLATWSVRQLQHHFPKSRLIIMSDGDVDERYLSLSFEAYIGRRLFPLEFGGQLVFRMLALFFHQPTAYLFKVDTDTGFHRKFRHLPENDGYFGTVQYSGKMPAIQGGCAGFTYAAAEKLYKSGILLSPDLVDYKRTWAKDPLCACCSEKRGTISTDWLTGYCMGQLNIPIFEFDDIRSVWKGHVNNSDLRYAVTHPCKDKRL